MPFNVFIFTRDGVKLWNSCSKRWADAHAGRFRSNGTSAVVMPAVNLRTFRRMGSDGTSWT